MLHKIGLRHWYDDENGDINVNVSDELRRVLAQGNGVYLCLDMPGGRSRYTIGFPVPFHTIVYEGPSPRTVKIAESPMADRSVYQVPERPEYRYGMRLGPWLFDHIFELPRRDQLPRHLNVNFVLQNGSSGFAGVVIRLERRENPAEEKLEIYHINVGNDWHYRRGWKDNATTALLACFQPYHDRQPNPIWRHEPVGV